MGRKNCAAERRLVFLSIESITSTKEARRRGYGASLKEIKEYTGVHRVALDAALKWLANKGLIEAKWHSWYLKETLPSDFCWEHGFTSTLGGHCIKCVGEGKYETESIK